MSDTHAKSRHTQDPSPWVTRYAALIARRGHILDLACGSGRHSRWLLAAGYRVTAVDRDTGRVKDLEDAEGCRVICADIEAGDWTVAPGRFHGVVMTNYLHRPLLPKLGDSLLPDGLLIIDTFATGNERFGRPRRADYLLDENELPQTFADKLDTVAYAHGYVAEPAPAIRQRYCGRKR